MTTQTQAPILSTPETSLFEDPTPTISANEPRLTDQEIWDVYEIERTVREVREGGYRRVALQFPDGMLGDGVRVYEGLERELRRIKLEEGVKGLEISSKQDSAGGESIQDTAGQKNRVEDGGGERIRLYILADTSYGSCCVDEIAAEHVSADVVVHYGRSCLSPTARLPVIYVFTSRKLDIADVVSVFEATFPEKREKIILMADIVYHAHIPKIHTELLGKGYENLLAPEIIHDPESQIPNRKLPEEIGSSELKNYKIFHVSEPPPALLLTLDSRVEELFIYPTTTPTTQGATKVAEKANSSRSLRRRYALLTSLTTTPILGILINTLSVRSYLSTVTSLQRLISSAGKKSYTFVVGKVNAAKIANFSEIGGWVVVGCWESSLIESKEFYRPIVTPFELGLALMGDKERVWDGRWWGGIGGVEEMVERQDERNKAEKERIEGNREKEKEEESKGKGKEERDGNEDSEEESAPPEYDFRTGRYVSNSRPMRDSALTSDENGGNEPSKSLTTRTKGELAVINGKVSPGAEYLRSMRTWTGLGSDFQEGDEGANVEEGRRGVARGYRVGDEEGERR